MGSGLSGVRETISTSGKERAACMRMDDRSNGVCIIKPSMAKGSSVSTFLRWPRPTIRAGRRWFARASVRREAFISQDDVSPALAPSGPRSAKARLRARPEKDDQPEVNDEQPDRKGCNEP